MTSRFAVLVMLVIMPLLVLAEDEASFAGRLAVERQRIASGRDGVDGRFAQEEANCYKQFATSDCLKESRGRRRAALADLRRQEVSINDEERRRKGALRQQLIDEKSSAESQQRTAKQREKALEATAIRQERAARHAAGPQTAATRHTVRNDEGRTSTADQRSRDASQRAIKAQERARDAQQRRERIEKRQNAQGKPSAAPLPVPP